MVDYCSVSDVKTVLHIDEAEVSEDAELAICVIVGSGLVDVFLRSKSLIVSSVVPELIRQATSNFVAWAYRQVQ